MTIYGVGYRRLEYQPTRWWSRIWAITVLEYKKPFRTRWGVILFILAFGYVLVKVVSLHIFLGVAVDDKGQAIRRAAEMVAQQDAETGALFNPLVPSFYFHHALEHGFLVFLVLTSLVSIRTIAADRATNGLEIYWTRSISPRGYFLAKWLGSFLLLAAVFVGGPLICWFYSQLIAPDWGYLGHTIGYVPLVLVVLLFQCLILSLVAVGFSAVVKSANLAWLLWIGVVVGGKVVAELLNVLARSFGWVAWNEGAGLNVIELWDAVARICYHLMGEIRPGRWPEDYGVGRAWCSLGCYLAAIWLILWRQLRTERAVA